jgi:signal peptidase I
MKNFILEIIESFITSFVVLAVIYLFLAFPEIVSGASMEPGIQDGERIIVEKVTKQFSDKPFKRGDVVVLHPPDNESIDYIKRVIGLPGEVVGIADCKVNISDGNGKFTLEEPYLFSDTCTRDPSGKARRLEANEYFVLGDNRERSADSRLFGPVTTDHIVGKAIFRFWPPQKLGFL